MTSRWRTEARELIADTIHNALEENPALADDIAALFDLVAKAYPLKARKFEELQVWVGEVAFARARFASMRRGTTPLSRYCKACGAGAGRPCVALSDHDNILSERQLVIEAEPKRRARELAAAIVHSARRSEAA